MQPLNLYTYMNIKQRRIKQQQQNHKIHSQSNKR